MSRRTAIAVAGAVAAGLLVLSGCGSSSKAPVGSPRESLLDQARAFSRCMRSHGVEAFPDPDSSGVWPKPQVEAVAGEPRFRTATRACGHLLPNGGPGVAPSPAGLQQIRSDMVKFAACMHAAGVPAWPGPVPDPEGGGRYVFDPQAAGIDPDDPRISVRMKTCDRVFPASVGVPPGAGRNP